MFDPRQAGVALACGMIVLVGCQSASQRQADREADAANQALLRIDPASVTPPPRLVSRLEPGDAPDAARRAAMSLDQIADTLPVPESLSDFDQRLAALGDPPPAAEPSPQAQELYLRSRLAVQNGDLFDAANALEQALRLTPDDPDLLAELGQLFTQMRNAVKARDYLRRAVAADPTRLESLYLLARNTLEKTRPQEAISLYIRALRLIETHRPPLTDVFRPLIRYRLGLLLQGRGYTNAAIGQFVHLVDADLSSMTAGPQTTEALLLSRQRPEIWTALGDLYHQQGDANAAYFAYRRAEAELDTPSVHLSARLIYSELKLGEPLRAIQRALLQLRNADDPTTALPLLAYLVDQGVSPDQLRLALQQIYKERGNAPRLAVAVSELLPEERAINWLAGHLSDHPGDTEVFEALLTRVQKLQQQASTQLPPQTWRMIVNTTARMIAEDASSADRLTAALLDAADDPQRVINTIDQAAADASEGEADADGSNAIAQRLFIVAAAYTRMGREASAVDAYRSALEVAADFAPARLGLVRLLIRLERTDEAAAALEPVKERTTPQVIDARLALLEATDQRDKAIALIDSLIADGQARPRYYLRKANYVLADDAPVQQTSSFREMREARAERRERHLEAEQVLLEGLKHFPQAEPLYAALLALYEPAEGSAMIPNAADQARQLLMRMLREIPMSPLTQRLSARELAQAQRWDEAVRILRNLIRRDRQDYESLALLLAIYDRTAQRREAEQLLAELIEANGESVQLLRYAEQYYRGIGREQQADAYRERWLLAMPVGELRAAMLGSLYLQTERPDKAVPLLEEAADQLELEDPVLIVGLLSQALADAGRLAEAERRIEAAVKRFPDHVADLLYRRSLLVSFAGEKRRAERLMRQVVERFPDHPGANNNLAYTYAQRGEKLDEALRMAKAAAAANENDAAILDTVGWVYYMRGEFDEAVRWLRRAYANARVMQRQMPERNVSDTIAVVLDHLGDALLRNDRPNEAARYWKLALEAWQSVEADSIAADEDLKELDRRLEAKIEAVNRDQTPPVAPLPAERDAGKRP